MVGKMDSHQLTCLLDAIGKVIIALAGVDAAAGMVVNCRNNRGIGEHCLLHDNPDVNGGLSDAALADADGLDEFIVLIAEQYPKLLYLEVLHLRQHIAVDSTP